uniref:DUF308 domain-containing protein n=2 Tax=unclassified Prevotella TaxID=2638335 RepID=A0AB33IZK3_9BACT
MKVLQSSFFRAICAIIVGALIIQYREQTVTWITIAIGVLFFLSGVISLAAYYASKRKTGDVEAFDTDGNQISGLRPSFPLVGLGSLILGVILAFLPTTFVTGLMYILAAILVLGAISQYVVLAGVTKIARIGFFYWLLPSVILLIAIFVMVKPMESAATPLFIIGWCMILYGVTECIQSIKIYQCRRKYKATIEATQKPIVTATETEEKAQDVTE